MIPRAGRAAVSMALVMSLSGCALDGFSGLYNTPLPGGAELGPDPYTVTVHFTDVLDLVPQASVKVNDVPVGRVSQIDLAPDNKTAVVSIVVNNKVRLPSNAAAKLRQSSLLGEKFVELSEPVMEQPHGRLANGAVIPVARTNRNPEIEEVLGALSMLLNGGDISQLQTIVKELNSTMSGNEAQIRSFLSNVEKVTADLDAQKADITRAIDALNRLSGTFVAQRGHIENALDNLGPGLQVINQQRDQLVTMLQELDKLSNVAVSTINRSKEDMVADLRLLAPTLQKLAETGTNLPKALTYLVTYPFPPKAAGNTLRGDYFNADLWVDMDLSHVVDNLVARQPIPGQQGPSPLDGLLPLPGQPDPSAPAAPPPPQSSSGFGGLLGSLLGGS